MAVLQTLNADADSPDYRSEWSRVMVDRLRLVRALQGGTRAMRAGGEEWLPKHPREDDAHYLKRLEGTFLFNVFERACRDLASKPFAQPPSTSDQSAEVTEFLKNVDLAGTDIQAFGRTFLNEAVRAGEAILLVTYPRTQEARNLREERDNGARPSFLQVPLENVLDITEQVVNGRRVVTAMRYRFLDVVRDGRFGEKRIWRIMVLEDDRWEEWTAAEGTSDWQITASGRSSVGYVPVVRLRVGEHDAEGMIKSVFEDLAWTNLEHWQSTSDQRNILSYARFPMLAAKGYKPPAAPPPLAAGGQAGPGQPARRSPPITGALEVGPGKVLVTPADGEFYYVEPKGTGIQAGTDDLKHIEDRMEYLALRPRVNQRSLITATGAAIEETDENNVVKALALTAASVLTRALEMAGDWLGQDWTGKQLVLNGDFEVASDRSMTVETILRLLDAELIPIEEAYVELQALGIFRARMSIQDVVAKVEVLQKARYEREAKAKESDAGTKTRLPGAVPSNTGISGGNN